MNTPYHGRGAQRQVIIPKDEPAEDLDTLSRVYTMLNTSTLPNIVYRIPEPSGAVVTHLGHMGGSTTCLAEFREMFSEFGDPVYKNLFVVEPPAAARQFAEIRWGFEFDQPALPRWRVG